MIEYSIAAFMKLLHYSQRENYNEQKFSIYYYIFDNKTRIFKK